MCKDDSRHDLTQPPFFRNAGQFCDAFFHAKWCYEWGLKEDLCIHPGPGFCYRTVVYIVAHLQEEGKPVYVARYKNCYRGHTESNLHAEEFLVADPRIQAVTQPALLTLWMTYQPCHCCSGSRYVDRHSKSCSRLLLDFVDKHPNLRLMIRCASLYRAHYTDPRGFASTKDAQVFRQRVALAQEGINLLCKHPRIRMAGFRKADWDWLMTLLPNKCLNLTHVEWEHRKQVDMCVTRHLSRSATTPPKPP